MKIVRPLPREQGLKASGNYLLWLEQSRDFGINPWVVGSPESSGYLGSKIQEMIKIVSFFIAAMFYIYIIYSEKADRYYIGHTNDPERRLIEHNTTNEIKFTTKYRPWRMLLSL